MSFREDVKKWANEALDKGNVSLIKNIQVGTSGTSFVSEYDLYSNYLTALDRYKDVKVLLKVSKTRDSHAFWNKAVKRHYREKNTWSDLIKQFRRKK